MSNAAWPGSLPEFVLSAGYKEAWSQQTIETSMDGGAVKTRRRFTRRFDVFTVSMNMDPDQIATFDTFYYDTCQGGSLPFDWVHPRLQTAMTWKFRKPPPNVADLNGVDVTVTWQMERQY